MPRRCSSIGLGRIIGVGMFIDTQVVSYAQKGRWTEGSIRGALISSVVANELLLAYGEGHNTANYYLPHPNRVSQFTCMTGMVHGTSLASSRRRDHPFQKRSTDAMVMELGPGLPTFVEFGSHAVAEVINQRMTPLFDSATSFLPKAQQKAARGRLRFLLEQELVCVPLGADDIPMARSVLSRFLQTHNPKDNFRNSWNDMLVLAVAMRHGLRLVTKDKELSRLAAAAMGFDVHARGKFLTLEPSRSPSALQTSTNKESKGFINTGWRFLERRRRDGRT